MSSARNSTTFEDVFEDAKFVEAYKVTQLITGQFARDLINRTGLLDAIRADPSKVKWFDDGCGPGVVANELVVMEPKAIEVDEYLATDLSPTMVQAAEMTMKSQGWQNGKTLIQDATVSYFRTSTSCDNAERFAAGPQRLALGSLQLLYFQLLLLRPP